MSAVEVDEVISASWVVPVETDETLKDHSVVLKDGVIVDILPTDAARGKYAAKTWTNLPGKVLLPGFVNAHTHSPMVLLRGVSDDIALREWLQTVIWPAEGQFVKADFVKEGAELAILEMIRGGTTTFNEMYWFPESVAESVVRSGIRAAIGIIAIEFPFASYGTGPDDYFTKGRATRERFLGEDLISWTISPHAPYTCSEGTLEKVKALSEEFKCPIHIHLHETAAECEASAAGNRDSPDCHMSDQKCTPLANLKRMGMLNDRLVAVHMTTLTEEEIKWCAEAGASVVHCPSSNMKLASGFCRVADLMSAGVNVALGTDGASSNNTLDMLAEMKLAAMLAKGVASNAKAVPALSALRMATLNGAKALGLQSKVGSLKVGKQADIIAIDMDTPDTWPSPTVAADPGFTPVSHIVYSTTRNQVTDSWVRGRRLMKEREVLTLPMAELKEKAGKWGSKVTEFLVGMKANAAA
mmetsp:Transcript_63205/g.150726  ORF Transcript_63205/g.150726 Transcript_63205/m.150726 type:complete len:470 (+) Transcript_63205:168-1577(+)